MVSRFAKISRDDILRTNELYLQIPKQRRNVAYWCLLAGRTGLLVGRKYFFLLNSRQNCQMHSKDPRHTVKKALPPPKDW